MKSTWFNDPHRREFAKLLHQADYSMNVGEVFHVFLDCATCTLRQAVHKMLTNELDDKLEEEYLRAIKRVKHPNLISHAFGYLTQAFENGSRYDFLGHISGEIGLNDKKYAGQCFTPHELCLAMAQLTIGDAKPTFGKTMMIDEPACGGGAMVIATAEALHANGFQPWNYHFRATDVSRRCFQMTYIQTTLLSIPCVCFQANSLTLEQFDSAANIISIMHPPRRTRDEPSAPERVEPVIEQAKPVKRTQGTLFDV